MELMDKATSITTANRRQFLRNALGTGAGIGLWTWATACSTSAGPAATATVGATDLGCSPGGSQLLDTVAQTDVPMATDLSLDLGAADVLAADVMVGDAQALDTSADVPADASTATNLDVVGSKMPYRQDDPAWATDLMWDRKQVIEVDTKYNGDTKADAESLLRNFSDGNSIGNEGCMLTCMAMVLRLLAAPAKPLWTPKTLNSTAQSLYYYTLPGLSMTTLYADLVAEVCDGNVQLCLKEEYLPGEKTWPKQFANTSALVRAYRTLTPAVRSDFLLMIKLGTYDDTVASHYVLLHPSDAGAPDDDDPEILDPAKPLAETKLWRISDSAQWITQDPDIAAGWQAAGILPKQIGGVWVFARWQADHQRSRLAPLIQAWAAELAKTV